MLIILRFILNLYETVLFFVCVSINLKLENLNFLFLFFTWICICPLNGQRTCCQTVNSIFQSNVEESPLLIQS